MKSFKQFNESLRDLMTPKSKEEINEIREKFKEFYDERKKDVLNTMTDIANELGVEIKIHDSGQEIDEKSYYSVEIEYKNYTYYMSTKPYDTKFNVGFNNDKGVGNWEDLEYADECPYYINQWRDEAEWRTKNNI